MSPRTLTIAGLGYLFVVLAGLWFTAAHAQYGIAHSFDENSYLFQARTFASGRLAVEQPAEHWPLRDWWTLYHDGKAYSKYPPGYPAVLALGARVGAASAVNPLLTVLALGLLFCAFTQLWGGAIAALATVVLGTNSYWLGYGASFHSQSASLFWTALGFLGVAIGIRAGGDRSSPREHLILGVAVGALVVTRPLDGLCLALAIVFASPRRFFRGPWWLSAGLAVAGAAGLFAYNYVQGGNFAPANYRLLDQEFKLVDPKAESAAHNVVLIARDYLRGLRAHVWPLLTEYGLGRTGFLLPLLTVGGWLVLEHRALKRFGAAFALLVVGLYNFHHTLGWPQYGARYYYPVLAALAAGTAAAIAWAYRRRPGAAVALTLAVAAVQIPHHVAEVRRTSERFRLIAQVRREIDDTCPPNTIVSIDAQGWSSPNRWVFADDFSKNLNPWDSRYYASRWWPLQELQRNFPERPLCTFRLAEHVPAGGRR